MFSTVAASAAPVDAGCGVRSAAIAIGPGGFWQAVSHGPLERGDGAKGECDEEEGGGRFDARALVHAVAGVAVS